MNTSSFLAALRAHASLPLVFQAGRDIVAPGYHLTEVKRVAYDTMDCGGMTHRWAETQLELWVPAAEQREAGRGHMAAEKFLRIIDRVQAALPLGSDATVRIHASFRGQPAALYDVTAVESRDGELWVQLAPDRTRCKAAERREAVGAGGCCGTGGDDAKQSEVAGCGCGAAEKEDASAACCA